MPRPTKSPTTRRTHSVQVRLDTGEFASLVALVEASGLTLSAFARAALLGVKIRPAPAAVDRDAAIQLRRIGANINELAKRGHSVGLNGHDREALAAALAELRSTLGRLTDEAAR